MLKHSISHYGTATSTSPTTTGLQLQHPSSTSQLLQTPRPLTSSSHSGGDSSLHQQQIPQSHHHFQQIDPTRFLEGPTYSQSYNKSYLEQSFPSVHNSRLYLDSSRLSRGGTTTTTLPKDISPVSRHKANGNISYLSPHHPSTILPPQTYNLQSNPISHMIADHTGATPAGIHHGPNPIATATATSGSSNPNTSYLHSSAIQSASYRHGVLRSLSLLSILSLLLALNSLIFLLKIVWPLNMSGGGGSNDSEFKLMYEVTLCLAAMCLSINLCVLLVTAAQYFFAVSGSPGSTKFLRRVTVIRGVAIGGFFLSIPLFLAALVLYTFTHLSFAIPALVTTFLVGVAIIFGGCSMVCHVVIWQQRKFCHDALFQEKTVKRILHPDISPQPTIELSTLV